MKFSDSYFGTTLNGSLWSLGPEFLCYLIVAALGLIGMLRLPVVLLLLIGGIAVQRADALGNFGYVWVYFAAGAGLYLWRNRPALNYWTAACALAGLILGTLLYDPSLAFAIFGSWLIIAVATSRVQIGGATRFGDLSYGLYLYGWPVEQALLYGLGTRATAWRIFSIALPLTAGMAVLSWRLVEAPALRWAGSRRFRPFSGR